LHQVHSARVVKFDEPLAKGEPLIEGDAITTNTPGLLMLMRFADCVPLYFYDPINHAAAIAHAGWKGTVMGVAKKTIAAMKDFYNSKPDELMVGIGPSIGPDHYFIGDDVINEAKNAYSKNWNKVLLTNKYGTRFDLWKANEISIREMGVKDIEIAGICTACENDSWFSHRAENGKTGRFAAVLGLK
jgi:YfiH family protein